MFGIANVAAFPLNYANQRGSNWSFTASLAADNKAGETATTGHLPFSFLDKDIVGVLLDAINGARLTSPCQNYFHFDKNVHKERRIIL